MTGATAPSVAGASAELDRRAARAALLAVESPVARGALLFAAGLYSAQALAARAIEAAHAERPLSGRLGDDHERLMNETNALLEHGFRSAPAALAEAASSRRSDSRETAKARLLVFWSGGPAEGGDYISRAVLRPYVETLRRAGVGPDRVHRKGCCPFCGGPPWIGVRRGGAEMEGARRFLGCALCGGEWSFSRILCPACLEEDPYKLPSFGAETHAAVRIEACETCRRYIKTIDLSADARPIPEVDDLVSLSMDLWAAEQGLTRIEPGLAGL